MAIGVAQGTAIATIRCVLGTTVRRSETPAYATLAVHPILFTTLLLVLTIAMIIKKKCDHLERDDDNFVNTVLAVASFYVLSQSANLVYLTLEGLRKKEAHVALTVSQALNCINMFGNFFVYLAFSRSFRRTLVRWLSSLG